MYQSQTFRLLKKTPSFMEGIAALIDLSPNSSRYHYDVTPTEADINALRADWFAVGDDLRAAIEKYERENQ